MGCHRNEGKTLGIGFPSLDPALHVRVAPGPSGVAPLQSASDGASSAMAPGKHSRVLDDDLTYCESSELAVRTTWPILDGPAEVGVPHASTLAALRAGEGVPGRVVGPLNDRHKASALVVGDGTPDDLLAIAV